MKIYSMTATFGKLEHQTLTLQPGLNIIHAPNEWGKSTWCAFLIAMLYGIDTRERTTQDTLAVKERYAPWSGAPMSGSMDINWNGRDITIERATKGRSIFGVFRAFETDTGLDVPELTAANCGQLLLGVEKSVFVRSGFLKLTDLPVTEDQALWRRLNALVTTGDESGASDALAQKLKDLKNQCRSNRANGLIPKAEAQRDVLTRKLSEMEQLRLQVQKLRTRKEELSIYSQQLENHRQALAYQAAKERAQKASAAQLRLQEAQHRTAQLEAACQGLPSAEALYQSLSQLQALRQQREALQMEAQMLPQGPAIPEAPAPFRGFTPEQALQQAEEDTRLYEELSSTRQKPSTLLFILGLCLAGTGIATYLLNVKLPGIIIGAVGLILAIVGLLRFNSSKQKAANQEARLQALADRYRPLQPGTWLAAAQSYASAQAAYRQDMSARLEEQAHLQAALEDVTDQLSQLTGGISYLQCEENWRSAIAQHNAYSDALRQQRQAEDLYQALGQDQPLPAAPEADGLTFTEAETARLLSDTDYELRQLQHQLGRCEGQMTTLGHEDALHAELAAVNARLDKLQQFYDALELAQQTLVHASNELQRRFAPRISQRAQAIFAKLTQGRYDRLTLGSDLSLSVSAENEDTLRSSQWRSDGTIDQLYLSLRLAVAEELTPDAPLVLDDALVRFDDTRLAAAMEVLQEASQTKQVLLFTCQKRETNYL